MCDCEKVLAHLDELNVNYDRRPLPMIKRLLH